MHDHEIDIVLSLLRSRRSQTCLEWGSGGSTLFFPRLIDSIHTWMAIEHDRSWYVRVKAAARHLSAVRVYYHSALETYPQAAQAAEMKFDFILVDGRERLRCLREAARLLAPSGICLLHDAHRVRYRNGWSVFSHSAWLTGMPESQPGADDRHGLVLMHH